MILSYFIIFPLSSKRKRSNNIFTFILFFSISQTGIREIQVDNLFRMGYNDHAEHRE